MWDEVELTAAAGSDYGLISRSRVIALGGTDKVIRARLRTGRWTKVGAGVYDLNVTSRAWRAQVRSATLEAGEQALASHRTACRLWNLEGIGGKVIEVTVPFRQEPIDHGFLVHRTRRSLTRAVTHGIPVTTVERTLLDVASLVPISVVEKVVMSSLHKRLTTADLVRDLLRTEGGRGVRGTRKLRQALATAEAGISGSPSEVDVSRLIRSAPIPRPIPQYRIPRPSGGSAYPDFVWPPLMKIVEVDGLGAHSSPDQLHDDLIRQNELMSLGWEIRRFSARQVTRDPEGVIREIVAFINS